jgi:pimeloyl-ACP methyl ester carboxylesterase
MSLVPITVAPHGVLIRGVQHGTGPPALLLHGIAGSWRNFQPWLPALLPRVSVIIPDLPGFGESPPPHRLAGLMTWARLLRDAMDALGTQPRILVGLDMGARLVMAYLAVERTTGNDSRLSHLVLHPPASHSGAVRPAFRWGVRLLGAHPTFVVVRRVLETTWFRRWDVRTLVEGRDILPEDARMNCSPEASFSWLQLG